VQGLVIIFMDPAALQYHLSSFRKHTCRQ